MLLVRPPRQRLVVSINYALESRLQSIARVRLTLRREDLPSSGRKVDTTTLIRLMILLINVSVNSCR